MIFRFCASISVVSFKVSENYTFLEYYLVSKISLLFLVGIRKTPFLYLRHYERTFEYFGEGVCGEGSIF